METRTPDSEQLVKYILGELPEGEELELEEKYFADREFLGLMLAAEDDLVDSYVEGRLTGERLDSFKRSFLSTREGRQKVENALALRKYLAASPAAEPAAERAEGAEKPSWWRSFVALFDVRSQGPAYALGALLLTMTVGLAWLVYDRARMGDQLAEVRQSQEELQRRAQELGAQEERLRARAEELEEQIAQQGGASAQLTEELRVTREQRDQLRRELNAALSREAAPDRAPSTLAFVLTPGITRGGGQTHTIPSGTGTINLRLPLPESAEDFPSYRVTLSGPQGAPAWSRDGLRAQATRAGKSLSVSISPGVLREGRNVFTVRGVPEAGAPETVEVYAFDVEKR